MISTVLKDVAIALRSSCFSMATLLTVKSPFVNRSRVEENSVL
jgi:hypothetical protein